jgi:hypothetical protein
VSGVCEGVSTRAWDLSWWTAQNLHSSRSGLPSSNSSRAWTEQKVEQTGTTSPCCRRCTGTLACPQHSCSPPSGSGQHPPISAGLLSHPNHESPHPIIQLFLSHLPVWVFRPPSITWCPKSVLDPLWMELNCTLALASCSTQSERADIQPQCCERGLEGRRGLHMGMTEKKFPWVWICKSALAQRPEKNEAYIAVSYHWREAGCWSQGQR